MRFKASVQDLFLLGSIFFALVIFGYIWLSVLNTSSTICTSIGNTIGANSNATVGCTQGATAGTNFISTIPWIVGLAGLGMIALAWFAPVPVIFLPVGIFLLLIAVVVYYQIQKELPTVFSSSFFQPLVAAYPLPALIAENLGLILLVFGVILLVVMYGRRGQAGGNPEG